VELLDRIVAGILAMPPWAAWIAIVLATFVSEDLTCVAAGLTAATGRMSAVSAIGAAALGIWLGDLGLYAAGKWIGAAALRRAPFAWFVHGDDVAASARWFEQRGPALIFATRFVPGTRLPTYVASGLIGTGFGRFALYTALAVALWAPILGGGTMWLGRAILPLIDAYHRWAWLALALAVAAYWLAIKLLIPAFTWRGRRMIVSRWRRATRWEFWPPWVFYPPLVVYIAWLALKHRSLSLFTAVNPGVPAGGFVGESKSAILEQLRGEHDVVARTRRIEATLDARARTRRVLEFMREHALDFPIVLKPDAGQRGSGVAVVRSEREVEAYLAAIRVDCVAQEHVPGEEFGVFYYRLPSEPRGRIFSITRKQFPRIRGDGVRTLERLILEDERAVCMARFYLDQHKHRLWSVLAPGEELQLVEIGNHCRGAIFLDGCELATPALEAAIERISRSFEGFYFGRYDVRAATTAAFCAGHGFKVIELNGATSEATHIYDPRHGLLFAYGVLFEQWRILFAIAAQNAARGAQVVGVPELLRLLSRYRVAARSHPK
jgi:membrane protein DedA with SNARE-associated domain